MSTPTHIILNQLGVAYSDCPTEALLASRLADALTVAHAVAVGVHRSPGASPAWWPSPAAWSEAWQEETIATTELNNMLGCGDLPRIHDKVDQVNAMREKIGIPFYVPPSDFQLLLRAPTSAGTLARMVQDQAASGQDPILLHPEIVDEIIAAASSAATPPPPPPPTSTPIGMIVQAPAGDTTPIGATIAAPDGTQWKRGASVTPWGTSGFYTRVA